MAIHDPVERHLRHARVFNDLRTHNERRAEVERKREADPQNSRSVQRILELNRHRIREQSRRPR